MPTLIELFESKQYLEYNNQTAKQYNEIKNSKDSPVESLDPVVNKIGASIVNAARKKNSERDYETIDEEERTGLLVYGQAASIPLYGTEIVRIDAKSTPSITSMKTLNKMGAGSNLFSQAASTIIGDAIGSGVVALGQQAAGLPTTFSATGLVTSAGAKITNTLTSLIPDILIPSKVQSIFSSPLSGITGRMGKLLPGNIGGSMIQSPSNLEAIATAARTAGVGSKLLASARGTTDQIRNQVIATGLSIAEEKVKKAVSNGIVKLLSKKGVEATTDVNGKLEYTPNKKYVNDGAKVGDDGKKPDALHYPKDEDITVRNDLSTKLTQVYTADKKLASDPKSGKVYFPNVYSYNAASLGLPVNPLKQEESNYDNVGNPNASQQKYSTKKSKVSIETRRQIQNDYVRVNTYGPYRPDDTKNLTLQLKDAGLTLDDMDFIPLKFYSINQNIAVNFLATITGLTETFTPTWESSRFVGSPFNIYTYSSIERSVQFNFKVYSTNPSQHIHAWDRLTYLTSLVYPQDYIGSAGAVVPPFIKFTLGDMYKNKEAFIESLIYTVDDNYPWEIGMNAMNEPEYEAKNYRLPTIIDVGITIRIIEHKNNTYQAPLVLVNGKAEPVKPGGLLGRQTSYYGASVNNYKAPATEGEQRNSNGAKPKVEDAAKKATENKTNTVFAAPVDSSLEGEQYFYP